MSLDGYFIEDLTEGMSAVFGKTITDADILMFAGVSGDTNPVHLNEEFAETFFDNVRVPASSLVGQPNKGWSMAKALLGFERIFVGSPKQSAYALARLRGAIEAAP